jgi:Flp pilus assembly protein TadB
VTTTTTPKTEKTKTADSLQRGVYWVAGTGAAFTLGAGAFGGTQAAVSAGIGSAIATANLWALGRIVAAFLAPADEDDDGAGPAAEADEDEDDEDDEAASTPAKSELSPDERREAKGRGAMWSVFALIKLFGLFAVVLWLIQRNIVSPLPFVLGYCALPAGITLGTVFPAPRRRRKSGRPGAAKT